jgi:glycosyltransferase involved in cell wall biosynthesis
VERHHSCRPQAKLTGMESLSVLREFSPKYISEVDSWHAHLPFAYSLMTAMRPKIFVELGTHYGDSYFTFCQARRHASLDTKCYAIDHWAGDSHTNKYGEEVFEKVTNYNSENYSDFSELIRSKFSDALGLFEHGSIELLHLDGFHTFEAVNQDFRTWLPKIRRNGIILIHDICVRDRGFGVWELWESIKNEFPSFSFEFGFGLGVIQNRDEGGSTPKIQGIDLSRGKNIQDLFYLAGEKVFLQKKIHSGQLNLDRSEKKIQVLQEKNSTGLQQSKDFLNSVQKQLDTANARIESLGESLSRKRDGIYPQTIKQTFDTLSSCLNLRKKLDPIVIWESPHSQLSLTWGQITFSGMIRFAGERLVKGIFLQIGKRTVACDWNIISSKKKREIKFTCSLRMGNGPKKCNLFLVLDDNSSIKAGARLLFSVKSKSFISIAKDIIAKPKQEEPYQSWLKCNSPSIRNRRSCESYDATLAKRPLFSFVMPVYEPPINFLKEAIASILDQTYTHWELCITNDAGENDEVNQYLEAIHQRNPRIKLNRRQENGGIAKATNDAIALAKGEFLVFIDHDDLIEPTALSEFACYIDKHPKTDFLYSDDDKVDINGLRYSPQFKPDWSPELLSAYCYVSHVKVVRTSTSAQVGHVREGFDGAQDYDYVLRLSEVCREIGHLPKVLYHWRALPGSTAISGAAKPESFEAGLRAVRDSYSRQGLSVTIEQPGWAKEEALGIYTPKFPDSGPEVTILIPSRNNYLLLSKCLESIESTSYQNFRITIIDNESDDPSTLELLDRTSHKILRLGNPSGKFNFSYLVNKGVEQSNTPYVLLLNDDTEVLNPNWLSQMVGFLGIEGVGSVGAKLLFPNNSIQHAGIIHGLGGGYAGPAFRNEASTDPGYLNYLRTPRNYSAVTAACLLTTKSLYLELGGFDETNFAVAYNDVDFCYRLTASGKRCVYCPDATLLHREGSSRGFTDNIAELASFKKKYRDFKDPFYNPNLSLENERFEIAPRRLPPPSNQTLRALAITHNLNLEGAPISMFEMICGVAKNALIKPTIISLEEGPLRKEYEKSGITVKIIPFPSKNISHKDYKSYLRVWAERVRIHEYDLLYANTLDTYFAIDAAHDSGVPSVWNIRESLPINRIFETLPPTVAQKAYDCFRYPYRVAFVAEATAKIYLHLNTNRNSTVIHNAINSSRIEEESKNQETASISFPENEKLILCVGTICARKGQLDLLKAFEQMPQEVIDSVTLVFIGSAPGNYAKAISERINANPALKKKVLLIGSKSDIKTWYKAAYLYVCASSGESYPRVILEAMHYSLPILTTPVFGIPEQVVENINALFFQPGDILELREKLTKILNDKELRDSLANASSEVLLTRNSFDMMVQEYENAFKEAAATG